MAPKSILNVGKEIEFLTVRCAVLASDGYTADWATPGDFSQKIGQRRFDLVILSAVLSAEEKRSIQAMIPADVRVIDLDRLILPTELLRLVAES